ncbi:hypothetical protein J5N97_022053 [Dioscorea zingiberensis]|uniref:Uncharacterized protein n=1 Tax=Dioscorea zingiberensis TaxID=325984 RepID=A0A9D5C9V0_9LILI|nr:hypothetical protein J5N97_022053 [Dioscorea zingiberensis]
MRDRGGAIDRSGRKKKVELLIPNLDEILGIKLNGRRARKVENTLDEATILADDLKRESTAGEVVEDARMVPRDVHATAQGCKIHIDGRLLGVTPQHDRVGLHIVHKVLSLQLRVPAFDLASAIAAADDRHRWSSLSLYLEGCIDIGLYTVSKFQI